MLKYTEITPQQNYLQISPNDEIIRQSHKVKKGENFNSIAKKYGVDVSALKEWNRMRSKKLKTGQKLIVYTTKKSKSTENEQKEKPENKIEKNNSDSLKKTDNKSVKEKINKKESSDTENKKNQEKGENNIKTEKKKDSKKQLIK